MADNNKQLNIKLVTEIENVLTFKVRCNRVLIKPSEKDGVRVQGGIIIPDGAAEGMLSSGSVVCVGENVSTLKAGDIVYFFRQQNEPGAVRQGTDVYFWFADYNIIAVLDTPPLQVLPDGEITQ